MKSHGEVLRQIRLAKGYSQKEIYTNIVSKSYAIEFEKGKHDMTISHFEKVLERLYLTYDEFKFIQQDYQHPILSTHYKEFMIASNNSDIPALKDLLINLADRKGSDIRLLVAQIRLNLIRIQADETGAIAEFPLAETQIISDFLLTVESWSLEEISLFANNINYLPFQTAMVLMSTATKNIRKYKKYHTYSDTFAGLLINFITAAIAAKELQVVKHYLEMLKETSHSFFDSWQREVYIYLAGIYLIKTGDLAQGKKQCQYLIKHLLYLEQTQRAAEFKKNLSQHLHEAEMEEV